jgi:hypothetical protein
VPFRVELAKVNMCQSNRERVQESSEPNNWPTFNRLVVREAITRHGGIDAY